MHTSSSVPQPWIRVSGGQRWCLSVPSTPSTLPHGWCEKDVEKQASSLPVRLTVSLPPLVADIPVIPDLEEVQEEDFVLQVAAPPRYAQLGTKLAGDREHAN